MRSIFERKISTILISILFIFLFLLTLSSNIYAKNWDKSVNEVGLQITNVELYNNKLNITIKDTKYKINEDVYFVVVSLNEDTKNSYLKDIKESVAKSMYKKTTSWQSYLARNLRDSLKNVDYSILTEKIKVKKSKNEEYVYNFKSNISPNTKKIIVFAIRYNISNNDVASATDIPLYLGKLPKKVSANIKNYCSGGSAFQNYAHLSEKHKEKMFDVPNVEAAMYEYDVITTQINSKSANEVGLQITNVRFISDKKIDVTIKDTENKINEDIYFIVVSLNEDTKNSYLKNIKESVAKSIYKKSLSWQSYLSRNLRDSLKNADYSIFTKKLKSKVKKGRSHTFNLTSDKFKDKNKFYIFAVRYNIGDNDFASNTNIALHFGSLPKGVKDLGYETKLFFKYAHLSEKHKEKMFDIPNVEAAMYEYDMLSKISDASTSRSKTNSSIVSNSKSSKLEINSVSSLYSLPIVDNSVELDPSTKQLKVMFEGFSLDDIGMGLLICKNKLTVNDKEYIKNLKFKELVSESANNLLVAKYDSDSQKEKCVYYNTFNKKGFPDKDYLPSVLLISDNVGKYAPFYVYLYKYRYNVDVNPQIEFNKDGSIKDNNNLSYLYVFPKVNDLEISNVIDVTSKSETKELSEVKDSVYNLDNKNKRTVELDLTGIQCSNNLSDKANFVYLYVNSVYSKNNKMNLEKSLEDINNLYNYNLENLKTYSLYTGLDYGIDISSDIKNGIKLKFKTSELCKNKKIYLKDIPKDIIALTAGIVQYKDFAGEENKLDYAGIDLKAEKVIDSHNFESDFIFLTNLSNESSDIKNKIELYNINQKLIKFYCPNCSFPDSVIYNKLLDMLSQNTEGIITIKKSGDKGVVFLPRFNFMDKTFGPSYNLTNNIKLDTNNLQNIYDKIKGNEDFYKIMFNDKDFQKWFINQILDEPDVLIDVLKNADDDTAKKLVDILSKSDTFINIFIAKLKDSGALDKLIAEEKKELENKLKELEEKNEKQKTLIEAQKKEIEALYNNIKKLKGKTINKKTVLEFIKKNEEKGFYIEILRIILKTNTGKDALKKLLNEDKDLRKKINDVICDKKKKEIIPKLKGTKKVVIGPTTELSVNKYINNLIDNFDIYNIDTQLITNHNSSRDIYFTKNARSFLVDRYKNYLLWLQGKLNTKKQKIDVNGMLRFNNIIFDVANAFNLTEEETSQVWSIFALESTMGTNIELKESGYGQITKSQFCGESNVKAYDALSKYFNLADFSKLKYKNSSEVKFKQYKSFGNEFSKEDYKILCEDLKSNDIYSKNLASTIIGVAYYLQAKDATLGKRRNDFDPRSFSEYDNEDSIDVAFVTGYKYWGFAKEFMKSDVPYTVAKHTGSSPTTYWRKQENNYNSVGSGRTLGAYGTLQATSKISYYLAYKNLMFNAYKEYNIAENKENFMNHLKNVKDKDLRNYMYLIVPYLKYYKNSLPKIKYIE